MKLLSFFLGAALVAMIRGQTDCDYDYVCDSRGSVEILKMEGAESPAACYKACQASRDDPNDPLTANCAYWTYYEELGRSFYVENDTVLDGVDGKLRANGKAVCHRLSGCETTFDISACGSKLRGSNCASGPGSCEDCDKCPQLNYDASTAAVSHWTCDIDLPYRKQGLTVIAPETKCHTSCPSKQWATGNFARANCVSKCDTLGAAGEWELLTPGVTDPSSTAVTPTADPSCPCEPITLGANQVPDPVDGTTKEMGAQFFCEAALIDGGSGLEDTMETDAKCKLFCHGHVAMDIKCIAGSWTAGVTDENDIYCWGPPLDCDYNPGVNSDVCMCAQTIDPAVNEICLPDQACVDGVCQATICVPDPDTNVVASDCFCQGSLGGASCTTGQTCIDGTCTT